MTRVTPAPPLPPPPAVQESGGGESEEGAEESWLECRLVLLSTREVSPRWVGEREESGVGDVGRRFQEVEASCRCVERLFAL